ncbi:hypothetical protein J6590_000792 [Homalodisca vitripennis]|nr:hypothetical protein J6590_000792 [Homalodisca vitripennis]
MRCLLDYQKTVREAITIRENINYSRVIIPDLKNVTVIGYSHCRGLATLIQELICYPGAGLLNVAPSPSSSPPKEHCYVLHAGTNELAAGWRDIIFRNMEIIIDQCKRSSKVLISPLPSRNGLPLDRPNKIRE